MVTKSQLLSNYYLLVVDHSLGFAGTGAMWDPRHDRECLACSPKSDRCMGMQTHSSSLYFGSLALAAVPAVPAVPAPKHLLTTRSVQTQPPLQDGWNPKGWGRVAMSNAAGLPLFQ